MGGIRLFLEPGSSTRIAALVLECKSLARFMKLAKRKSTILWRGHKAALIKNPARGMWNIVVVEK